MSDTKTDTKPDTTKAEVKTSAPATHAKSMEGLIALIIELQGPECNSSFFARQLRHREIIKRLLDMRGTPPTSDPDAQAFAVLTGASVLSESGNTVIPVVDPNAPAAAPDAHAAHAAPAAESPEGHKRLFGR